MPTKRRIGGSGDAGATKAPEHGVEMETEVAITAGELSLHPDIVDIVGVPQSEAEFHTDSGDDSGDDPGNDFNHHYGDDADNDGQLVSHLYPFMCQIDPRVSLVTPASPFLE